MAENSKIEWCDDTFNPWEGCQKAGPGCDNCYAEARNARFSGGTAINWGVGAPRRRTSDANWRKPLAWNATHAEFFARHGRRRRVFCASLADVFDNAIDPAWRVDLFKLIAATPNLDWLLLTKRIGNADKMIFDALGQFDQLEPSWMTRYGPVLPNVWLGATIVNREEMLRDGPKLQNANVALKFWSYEPALGPLGNIPRELLPNWVICGGESGRNARPMHPDWARSLRDQCAAAGVPFLLKQWGEFSLAYDRDRDDPDYQRCGEMDRKRGRWVNLAGGFGFNGDRVHFAERVGKKRAGRLLDGREHNEFPGALL